MSDFITYDMNLYKLLNMKIDKRYTIKDVKKIIYKKNLVSASINYYFPSIKCCACGKCTLNNQRLFDYVESNLIYKPINIYYEYTQQPVEIKNMVFE